MSMEEKKKILLKIYHTKLEPFTIKELEREGGKAGLYEKQVKDINCALLDDNLVHQEKMGNTNVFWSFPGAEAAKLRMQVDAAKARLSAAEKRLTEATAAVAKARVGREDKDGTRAAKLKELGVLVERRKKLEAELEERKENDPEELKRIVAATKEFKANAERWNDNLFALKKYLVTKKNATPEMVHQLFRSCDLPDDLDLD